MQGRNMYRWGRAKTPCADTVAPWRIAGLTTVMALLPVTAWACAVCFAGDDALARGMNISILFLMSMPFTIFGTIFGAVYLTQKRAQRHGRKSLAWTQKESAQ